MSQHYMTSTAYVEIRGQHSVGGSRGFGGPDTYVTVQYVPDNQMPLRSLQARAAQNRGIRLQWIGEGYSKHRGARSALGQAIAWAERIADRHNRRMDAEWCRVVHHAD